MKRSILNAKKNTIKCNSDNMIANALIRAKTAAKTKKPRVRKPYPYDFNRFALNHESRAELLGERIRYWLEAHPVDGKPMSVTLFTKYVNSFSSRTGITFSSAVIYQYLAINCSPKIDRCYALAMAMGVSVQWLTGYGPREVEFGTNFTKLNALIDEREYNIRMRTRKASETRRRRKNDPGQEAA